jgi:hypothetical protein
MIRGYCKTNLDEYKHEDWPTAFVSLPRKGDWVQAKSGKVLCVCQVTHCQAYSSDTMPRFDRRPIQVGDPFIIVELTGWGQ